MRISTTERQLFKRCRRKWDYASYNRQSLSPIVNAPALDLGTLVHATLAQWTQDPSLDPLDVYVQLSAKHIAQVRETYYNRVGCNPAKEELLPILEAIGLGETMIANYHKRWHTPLPAGFQLIENELTLIQEISGTEHCSGYCNMSTCKCWDCGSNPMQHLQFEQVGISTEPCTQICHELECTFDGVMADANGDLYIIERKTYGRTPSVDELNNNDQFLAYQWALSQKFKNVVGVSYDGLLKKEKPPAGKTIEDMFIRRLLLRNTHELEEFGQLLSQEANDMADPNLRIYKTVPFMGCMRWECTFMDLCHATSKGNPTTDLMKMFVRSERKKHLDLVEESV